MRLNEKVLKNKMIIYKTRNKAINDLRKLFTSINHKDYIIEVKCFTYNNENIYDTTLSIDIYDFEMNYYNCISIANISLKENDICFHYFRELTCDILNPIKNSLVKDIEKMGYEVYDTKDCYCK